VKKKVTLAPTPEPTAEPTSEPTPSAAPEKKKEENYAEYEKYAEADKSILPDLDIAEDKQAHRVIYKPKIDFYFGKDLIKPASFPMLSRLAEELGKYNDAPLVVQGQPSGPAWLRPFLGNSLSRARANSVLRHLIVTEKIRQINVNALGEGDEFPDLGKRSSDQPVLLIIVK
jgi:outer membrane protein OmpA-like peptidoglycan-associated protein